MSMIIAVDPGTTQSAYVMMEGKKVIDKGIVPNEELLEILRGDGIDGYSHTLAIEMVASYGMPIGKTTMETILWTGRFIEAVDLNLGEWKKIYRKEVTLHLCNSAKAKDSNVMAAVIDKYGGTRRKAVGLKKDQGPLFGFSTHLWAAIGVGLTYQNL